MKKSKRQEKILDLIAAIDIPTQDELNELLEKNGIYVNQSSISRDLDELGIIKINGFYSQPPMSNQSSTFGVLDFNFAGDNLIVGKCGPGLASAVAVLIDRAKVSGIVGTIAGDDTIFIAVKDSKQQKQTARKIRELFDR